MSVQVAEPKSTSDIIKLLGVGALSLGLNYLIFAKLLKPKQQSQPPKKFKKQLLNEIISHERTQINLLSSKKQLRSFKKDEDWGSVKLINQLNEDPLLKQLKLLDSLLCEVSRVNHLIVDLELPQFKPHVNRLIATKIKYQKEEPFLHKQATVVPGQFVIKQAKFIPGVTLELQKKYMRAGPRGSEFFNPDQVRADIVCLGGVCPGMNTIIREITIMLKQVYQVISVTGVRNGFNGYYERRFVDLNPQVVETSHHYGGCMLGLCQTQFHLNKIIDSLVERKINQVYLIGANKTMRACQTIHKQIRKRKLPIGICVLLKGINRDVPIFDSCFGFQTAVEESSRVVEKAYSFSHSFQNGVSLVKLPGYSSGFLASYTVLSTINTNICLVPEFQFDMFGEQGLLAAIIWRLKNKGSCTLVYSQGTQNALRDCCIKKSSKQQTITQFDNFLQGKIEQAIRNQNLGPFQIGVFNAIYPARSAPANSIDTKLCWYFFLSCSVIAQASVMGVMAGYTNFAVGHLANKSAMISIDELVHSESVTQLREHDDLWQQTIMTTGQPRLRNDRFQLKSPQTFLRHMPSQKA